jgi:hypothetical protein
VEGLVESSKFDKLKGAVIAFHPPLSNAPLL